MTVGNMESAPPLGWLSPNVMSHWVFGTVVNVVLTGDSTITGILCMRVTDSGLSLIK